MALRAHLAHPEERLAATVVLLHVRRPAGVYIDWFHANLAFILFSDFIGFIFVRPLSFVILSIAGVRCIAVCVATRRDSPVAAVAAVGAHHAADQPDQLPGELRRSGGGSADHRSVCLPPLLQIAGRC